MRVIGLTGGVGTGKSTVSQYLQELGAVLLDADKVGHESYRPHTPTWKDLVAAFGRDILQPNEEIDRKKLGTIVFSDPKQLARLNGIVHPRMREMMREKLEQLRKQGVQVVVLEAAILIEANWTPLVDEVWVMDVTEEAVVRRLQKRNGWSEEQIRARMRSQMPREERLAKADVVVNTDGSLDEVRERVRGLWKQHVAGKV